MSLDGGLEEVVEFLFQTRAFALQIRDSCQRSVQLFLQQGDHGLQPFTVGDNGLCVSPCLNSIRTISEITYTNLPSL